ncbi:MAG: hypothetical protein KC636_17220, partial [Myxococcales bacterium]|nr:hypothetical protein [Myxococcales bacterium]
MTRDIVLEFARSVDTGDPHAFRFEPQQYVLRLPGGRYVNTEVLEWGPGLLKDLAAVRMRRDPVLLQR